MTTIAPNSKISCLLFKCNDLLFATPVLSIREILSSQSCRIMSGNIQDFLGVFNNRGLIVGVIDFAARLNTGGVEQGRKIFLTFDTHQGVLAVAIDEVLDIEELETGDEGDDLNDNVGNAYFYGMVKSSYGLVSLLDIRNILSVEELDVFRKNAIAPKDVFDFNFNENLPVFEHVCRLQEMKKEHIEFKETDFSVTSADVYKALFETYRLVMTKYRLQWVENRVVGDVNPADLFQLSFDISEKLVEKWGKQELTAANQAAYKKILKSKQDKAEWFTPGDVMQIIDYMKQIASSLEEEKIEYRLKAADG